MLKHCTRNFSKRFLRYKMSKPLDISDLRKAYNSKDACFDLTGSRDPFQLFCDWFGQVLKKDTTVEANAMSLATATPDGKPSLRVVLMKSYKPQGFSFYTNYNSRKGRELKANPEAYLLFYWPTFQRQVRVEGLVEKVAEEESQAYFARRPRESQISAYASEQSTVVAGKQELEARRQEVEKLFENKPIEKPADWGGYILKPRCYEFWQGQSDRFHDRIVFRRPQEGEKIDETVTKNGENGWVYERLCP